MAFFLEDYERILDGLLADRGRDWLTITQAAALLPQSDKLQTTNVMRHDIDRSPKNAEAMAKLEAAKGITATYYFRCTSAGQFPEDTIRNIASLGHEVGYHYECLSRCQGNHDAAIASFKENLLHFRSIAACSSAAMHGAPLSPYDNQDLLVGIELSDLGLDADAVLSFAQTELVYLTDTGGRWNAGNKYNLRDYVGLRTAQPPAPDVNNFAFWISQNKQLLILSTHSERWAYSVPNYLLAQARDYAANTAKLLVRSLRQSKRT